MIIDNFYFTELDSKPLDLSKTLVLCAFNRLLSKNVSYDLLRQKYPNADIVMFSTSGHFIDSEIQDEVPVVCAIAFEKSSCVALLYEVEGVGLCTEIGKKIGRDVGNEAKGLCIISDGSLVNGTDLIEGINSEIQRHIPVFGGMAGDSTYFEETWVGLNENPTSGKIIAISFYGDALTVQTNCDSGWTSLGLEFKITQSNQNELVELNHKNAYEILYDFLGSESPQDFTRDTLYYPFLLNFNKEPGVIRTPIRVDHGKKTLTYAGNMPVGASVVLMKTGTMELLDATLALAQKCYRPTSENQFVFAISCVGRRVVLDDMTNEEFTEIKGVFGDSARYFGFYSYGEFSRIGFEDNCKLHNQTLTLAVLSEN